MARTLPTFSVRPIGSTGSWATFVRTHRSRTNRLLSELQVLAEEVQISWPTNLGDALTNQAEHPELWEKCERRDTLSDVVRVTAAMAVEGFLNFYGMYRLGPAVFDEHYERLGLVPKLRGLLLICDHIDLPKKHLLVTYLDRVAHSRNGLVHPKAIEVVGNTLLAPLSIPGEAEEVVTAMESFFAEFANLVPEAAFLTKQP